MIVDSEKLLDAVGWRILEELQHNGRLSFAELGRRVNLSLPAIAERVRRMEETGIITGYHASVDAEKLHMAITAFIRMSTSKEGCAQVVAVATECAMIRECYRVTGGDSYMMKVAVPSIARLEALIDRLMPFGSFSTSIVLSTPVVKHVFERDTTNAKLSEPRRTI